MGEDVLLAKFSQCVERWLGMGVITPSDSWESVWKLFLACHGESSRV